MTGAESTVASGERSFAIAGDVSNSVIVTGDNNTLQVRVDGNDALLANLLSGSAVPRKSLRPLPLSGIPAPAADHIDRAAEALAVRDGLRVGRAFEISGVREIGKTFVVRYALAGAGDMPDGTVYVFAKDLPYADVLQELHEAFYQSEPPALAGAQQIRIDLAERRALVVLDAVALERDELRQLTLMLPRCMIVLVARDRVGLGEGGRLAIGGLALDDAIALVEQELGRPLQAVQRPAAEQLVALLEGHPFQLRQAAAGVRDGEHSFAQLVHTLAADAGGRGAALAQQLVASLTPADVAIVEQLAALRAATVGIEHLAALAGAGNPMPAVDALEARRLIASGSPRYRIAGALHELSVPESTAVQRATDYFSSWSRANRWRPATVLDEAPALLELIARAAADGRDADAIELGRASDAAFAWGRRWQTWGAVLQTVLAAAQRTGDRSACAWALHQLGIRAYGLGDSAAAVKALEEALHIREQLGEHGGAAASRYNLDFIRNPPVGGDDDDGGGDGPPRWPGGFSPALLAVLVALVAGVGAAVAVALSSGGPSPRGPIATIGDGATSTHQVTTQSTGTKGTPPGRTDPNTVSTSTGQTNTGSDAGPAITTPGTVDLGELVVGTDDTNDVDIRNNGERALQVTSRRITGDDAADFQVSPDACASVAAETTCNLPVTFRPTTYGDRAASLTIESDAPGSPSTVALAGYATPAPVFQAKGGSFGTRFRGLATTMDVTVSNAGPAGSTLRLTADPALLDGSAGSFRIAGGTCRDGGSLNAGESCTVTIEFKPTTTGDQRATLAIADNAGAPDKVQLTGAGQDPPFQGPR